MKIISYALGLSTLAVIAFSGTKSFAANPRQVSHFENTGECIGCDLSGASFAGIDFTDTLVNLRDANLNGASFTGAIMPKANFSGTSAVGTNFFGADLQGANFTNTSLTYANLVKAKLNNASIETTDFQGANLAEADLSGAKITKTNFSGTNLYKAQYPASITNSIFGNIFKSNQKSQLLNGSTIMKKMIGDRTGGSIRIYRTPAWLNSRRRPSVPASVGSPSTTGTGGSRIIPDELFSPTTGTAGSR